MITNEENFRQIVSALQTQKEIDCVALGGSRAVNGSNDEFSDYDIYVYCKQDVPNEKLRKEIILPLCTNAEICNHYWESEDNCIMKSGTEIDIIYRTLQMMKQYLTMVIDHAHSFNGYTTCFWYNIVNSKILFDKSGTFSALQQQYTMPYPEPLRTAVISNNRRLLSGCLPSYDAQIKKAEARGDAVSVHHRTTEFLSSYFDIIFAVNRQLHPGEKRLIQLCKANCKILPNNFEENILSLINGAANGSAFSAAQAIVAQLDKIL